MYKKTWELIENSYKIAIISHINPDGDALGSSLALYSILKKMKKNVSIINTTKDIIKNVDYLFGYNKIKSELPINIDLLISCDCANFERLGIDNLEDKVKIINIDHHISNTEFGDINIIEPNMVSTSLIIYKLLKANNIKIDKDSAEAIYTSIVTDSNFFQFERVNREVFLISADLIDYGVNPNYIANMLNKRIPLSKLRLEAETLSSLELLLNGKVSKIELTEEMFQKTGASVLESDKFVNKILNLVTVEVAILIREELNGDLKFSLRSKNYIDVNKIANIFNGGGHKKASGFTIDKSKKQEVLNKILQELEGLIIE